MARAREGKGTWNRLLRTILTSDYNSALYIYINTYITKYTFLYYNLLGFDSLLVCILCVSATS